METGWVEVPGAELEVRVWGSGEPVVFIQTALTAEELRPLASAPALDSYRKILYHRRGYAGSSATEGPGSITRDAADCATLLGELQIHCAHIVGLSYSGAVALQFGIDAPQMTHSLTLIEPPPVHTRSASDFRAVNNRLMQTRREEGAAVALDEFMTLIVGPEWQQTTGSQLPGSTAQMRRDARTFFDVDLPALLAWEVEPEDVADLRRPVLYIGGTQSGYWFAEVRDLILSWLPQAEDVAIDGADHSLCLTHTQQIAGAVAAFMRRHPIEMDSKNVR